jgi:hypothetical protein
MTSPCCLCLWVSPPIKFWMPEPSFWNLACISRHLSPYLNSILHKSLLSVCMHVLLGNSLEATFLWQWIHTPIAGCVIFYMIRVTSQESLWACLCIPLLLLCNSLVNMFLRQWRIVRGIIYYVVWVVSKKKWVIGSYWNFFFNIKPHFGNRFYFLFWWRGYEEIFILLGPIYSYSCIHRNHLQNIVVLHLKNKEVQINSLKHDVTPLVSYFKLNFHYHCEGLIF